VNVDWWSIVVGFLGAIIGAGAGFGGSIIGANLQINHERKRLREEEEERKKEVEEQRRLYEYAVENFLRNEIQDNFRSCFHYGGKTMKNQLEYNECKFQHDLSNYVSQCKFDEYNKLKYELVKLEVSKVQEIIEIYDMFYLLRRKKDIGDFTQSEYERFKKSYITCYEEYYEI
jgi:hypothetical protein